MKKEIYDSTAFSLHRLTPMIKKLRVSYFFCFFFYQHQFRQCRWRLNDWKYFDIFLRRRSWFEDVQLVRNDFWKRIFWCSEFFQALPGYCFSLRFLSFLHCFHDCSLFIQVNRNFRSLMETRHSRQESDWSSCLYTEQIALFHHRVVTNNSLLTTQIITTQWTMVTKRDWLTRWTSVFDYTVVKVMLVKMTSFLTFKRSH